MTDDTAIGVALAFMGAIMLICALVDAPPWSLAILGGVAVIRGLKLIISNLTEDNANG